MLCSFALVISVLIIVQSTNGTHSEENTANSQQSVSEDSTLGTDFIHQLKTKDSIIQKLQTSNDALKELCDSTELQCQHLQNVIQQMNEEDKTIFDQQRERSDVASNLAQQLQTTKSNITHLEETNDLLQTKMAALQQNNQRINDEKQAQNQRIEELESNLVQSETQISTLRRQIFNMNSEAADRNDDTQNRRITALETKLLQTELMLSTERADNGINAVWKWVACAFIIVVAILISMMIIWFFVYQKKYKVNRTFMERENKAVVDIIKSVSREKANQRPPALSRVSGANDPGNMCGDPRFSAELFDGEKAENAFSFRSGSNKSFYGV